ncbi:hypothetical protein Tco_1205905, partial [Tanacetum coccineum]
LQGIHNTFHVSNLKKCLLDEDLIIPLDKVRIDEKLHFIEEPIKIMDMEVKQLKQSCNILIYVNLDHLNKLLLIGISDKVMPNLNVLCL